MHAKVLIKIISNVHGHLWRLGVCHGPVSDGVDRLIVSLLRLPLSPNFSLTSHNTYPRLTVCVPTLLHKLSVVWGGACKGQQSEGFGEHTLSKFHVLSYVSPSTQTRGPILRPLTVVCYVCKIISENNLVQEHEIGIRILLRMLLLFAMSMHIVANAHWQHHVWNSFLNPLDFICKHHRQTFSITEGRRARRVWFRHFGTEWPHWAHTPSNLSSISVQSRYIRINFTHGFAWQHVWTYCAKYGVHKSFGCIVGGFRMGTTQLLRATRGQKWSYVTQ